MMTEISLYQLGSPIPGWSGPRAEGSHFNIDPAGALLHHFYRRPTAREIRGARSGKTRFALVPAGDHTLFLAYHIEGLTSTWSDASYAVGLLRPERRQWNLRKPGQGYLLLSILADADSGMVHVLRGVSVTPAFSDALDTLIASQRAALPRFTPAAHDAEISAAYQRWPKSEAMLPSAVAVERGGLPFQTPGGET